MTFYSNKAAVYLQKGDFEDCIKVCQEGLDKRYDISGVNRDGATYDKCAKLLCRMGACYAKMNKFDESIESYQKALTEDNNRFTRNELREVEKAKQAFSKAQYEDPALAEKHREAGNQFFKSNDYVNAKKEYDEAIKRNPRDAKLYSNRAAALTKLVAYPDALRDLEECLKLDPKFVKAYSRKGTVHLLMKENHKAIDAYKAGLAIDPNNAECQNGLRQVNSAISQSQGNDQPDEEQIRHAMADPEIQSILSDPQINMVLKGMQENPQEAMSAMKDPKIKNAIEKLVAAGILKIR